MREPGNHILSIGYWALPFHKKCAHQYGDPPPWLHDGVRDAIKARPWFIDEMGEGNLFPRGPRLILYGDRQLPSPEQFQIGGWPIIRVLPEGAPDPTNPTRVLADVIRPEVKLHEFIGALTG